MGGRVAQGQQRIEGLDGPLGLLRGVHALGFVDDDDGPRRLDVLDGPPPGHFVLLLVNYIELFALLVGECVVVHYITGVLLERLNVDDHNLDFVADRELAHLGEVVGAVDEVVEGRVVVESPEVLAHQADGGEHALADGHRGHHDDEFLEAVLAA